MGNKVGTVLWTPSWKDTEIKSALRKKVQDFKLVEADSHYMTFDPKMTNFGVSIDGIWTLVQSEEMIKNFLREAKVILERAGIEDVKITYQFLPM